MAGRGQPLRIDGLAGLTQDHTTFRTDKSRRGDKITVLREPDSRIINLDEILILTTVRTPLHRITP